MSRIILRVGEKPLGKVYCEILKLGKKPLELYSGFEFGELECPELWRI